MHLDGRKAEFRAADHARHVPERVKVRAHHRGAEIDSGEGQLRARREHNSGERLPGMSQQQHDGDGNQKLRLEDQKS